MAHFVFMLTHGDRTVDNAAEIVPTLADTGLRYIGFKDVGADLARQREVTSLAHDAGFEVMLEVVSTTKEAELSSLQTAAEAGVDWVLGGTHGADTAGLLPDDVKYCPFPGQVVDHPSVLLGDDRRDRRRRGTADRARPRRGPRPAGVSPPDRRHARADPCGGRGIERPGDRRGIDREHRAGRRGERGRRVGLHDRQRHLRRPAARGSVHRGPGPPSPRGDGRRRCRT